jgi:hypothetical protein
MILFVYVAEQWQKAGNKTGQVSNNCSSLQDDSYSCSLVPSVPTLITAVARLSRWPFVLSAPLNVATRIKSCSRSPVPLVPSESGFQYNWALVLLVPAGRSLQDSSCGWPVVPLVHTEDNFQDDWSLVPLVTTESSAMTITLSGLSFSLCWS